MQRKSRSVVAMCVALALAGCSGDDDDDGASSSGGATTTTLAAADAAMAYTEPGPYPVGVTTLALDGEVPVEVWYPAVEGSTGQDSYDMRTKVPEAVRTLLTADVPAVYTYDATRDAEVAEDEFPLVLFSHGASGVREQSTFLTAHLASWGMVVASPDHWSRDLFHTLERTLGGASAPTSDATQDLQSTRELLEQEDATAGSRFEGRIGTNVAAVGHSAGGGTVLDLAGTEDVEPLDGYASLASGAGSGRGNGPTTSAGPPPELPDTPSLFVAGKSDQVVPWDTVSQAAFELAPAPSLLWVLDEVGHNGFDDFCTFGNGTGIIGVADASGLGPLLDAQPQFRALGEDGCVPPAAPVAETFPIIEHVVTAWLRHLFGVDPEPVGLGPDVADEYAVAVTIEAKN